MEIYVNISFFYIFFLVFKHDFIRCDDFTRIATSNRAVMALQIRSHIQYLTQIYYMLVLIL